MAWAASGCAGQVGLDGGVASVGGSGSDHPTTGGAPAASGSGGRAAGSGGQSIGDGGQLVGSGGSAGVDGEPCARPCSAELETCSAGSCVAKDTVRTQTPVVHVPGGTFLMGDESANQSSPVHERTVLDFSLDQTEVTAGAYDQCVLAGACTPADSAGLGANSDAPGYENYPVNHITLRQAETYCAWMGKRLPTEAEWEYAAGGLQGFEYPWGDAIPAGCIPGILNPTPEEADYDHGCAVGQFSPNENGFLDMGGGVYEFTSSPFCAYSASTDTGYVAGCDAQEYALRDGAFTSSSTQFARVAFRQPASDEFTSQSIGFRCATSTAE